MVLIMSKAGDNYMWALVLKCIEASELFVLYVVSVDWLN